MRKKDRCRPKVLTYRTLKDFKHGSKSPMIRRLEGATRLWHHLPPAGKVLSKTLFP